MKTIKELEAENSLSSKNFWYKQALKDVIKLIDKTKEEFYPNKFKALTDYIDYLKARIEGKD